LFLLEWQGANLFDMSKLTIKQRRYVMRKVELVGLVIALTLVLCSGLSAQYYHSGGREISILH